MADEEGEADGERSQNGHMRSGLATLLVCRDRSCGQHHASSAQGHAADAGIQQLASRAERTSRDKDHLQCSWWGQQTQQRQAAAGGSGAHEDEGEGDAGLLLACRQCQVVLGGLT